VVSLTAVERSTEEDIARELEGSPWRQECGTIVLDRKLPDFAAAMTWVNHVADVAERANHHPDILVHGWNRVRLTLTTHSAGGLTSGDFQLARTIDAID